MTFEGQFQDSDPFIGVLNQQFDQDNYTNIIFMSAWTRLWPIDQINESLVEYLSGGGRFTLYTGNSFRSTSIEAMDHLMHLAAQFPGQVHVYVCAQNTGSFHPKVYLFINSDDQRSWLSVGSSNLTHGGMNTNAEANLISTDWDQTASVVRWWVDPSNSVNQLRLTPFHLGTQEEPGPLREMFRTEDAISNRSNQSEETTAHDLQLIVDNANNIVNLDSEEVGNWTEGDPEDGETGNLPAGCIESLFIKRISTDLATSNSGGYMDLSISVVEDGFFGSYPLPNPDTGTGCIGRLNLNVVLNNNIIGARIEERINAAGNRFEGARFLLDGYTSERFNEELPTGSYKLFIRTTAAHGSQIYVWFITPAHPNHAQVEELFAAHDELYNGSLPRGRRNQGLNVVFLRGNVQMVTALVDGLKSTFDENLNEILLLAMQDDPDLRERLLG